MKVWNSCRSRSNTLLTIITISRVGLEEGIVDFWHVWKGIKTSSEMKEKKSQDSKILWFVLLVCFQITLLAWPAGRWCLCPVLLSWSTVFHFVIHVARCQNGPDLMESWQVPPLVVSVSRHMRTPPRRVDLRWKGTSHGPNLSAATATTWASAISSFWWDAGPVSTCSVLVRLVVSNGPGPLVCFPG